MTPTNDGRPVVLVVEDETDVATSFEMWLAEEYDVRVATDGREALDALSGVDVVLLDRMMPGLSGDEVLQRIRDRGVDCRVAMVTAVDPGFDVVELGFDAYVSKPPTREQLRDTVEELLDRSELDAELREYYSLTARRSALEDRYSDTDLREREEYSELLQRIAECRDTLDESMPDLAADAAFVGAVRDVVDGAGETHDATITDDAGDGETGSNDEVSERDESNGGPEE